MINLCKENNIKEPEFKQEDMFKTILWRKSQVPVQVDVQVPVQVDVKIFKLLSVVSGDIKRSQIKVALNEKHEETFLAQYLTPAMNDGLIEMTKPDSPNHPKQAYRLTKKGEEMKRRGISKIK